MYSNMQAGANGKNRGTAVPTVQLIQDFKVE